MDSRQIEYLLRQLRCRQIRTLHHKGWVEATCPLEQWEHGKGRDTHPSFGVKISKDKSYCRCQACGAKGDLFKLLQRLHYRYKVDCTKLFKLVTRQNASTLDALTQRVQAASYTPGKPRDVAGIKVSEATVPRGDWEEYEKSSAELPESDLARFVTLPQEVVEYLMHERRLTSESIAQWELGWHPGVRRIVIPIRDVKGRLVGMSGKALDKDTKPKYLHSKGFRKDYYLYGEHLVPEGTKTVTIVEGFFDVMWIHQCGLPALAVMGSYVGRIQEEKLARFYEEAVVMPDGDAAGEGLGRRLLESLGRRMPTRLAMPPKGLDPDNLSQADLERMIWA